MILKFTPRALTVALLSVSILQMFVAWSFQSEAARDLADARRLSETEVDSPETEPESVADYRAILATLEESIAIRRDIDALLAEVEGLVSDLRTQQATALETSTGARTELQGIAATLGGAVNVAHRSFAELQDLEATLATSARLAALIAEELEELDRKMGPTIP